MKKLIFLLSLLLPALLPGSALAQFTGPFSLTGSQCTLPIGTESQATVGIYVYGTWTGTLQPEATIQGQAAFNMQVQPSTSTTLQSTITANGAYVGAVAGYSSFQLCGNTVASGTAKVYLQVSTSQLGSTIGGLTPFTSPLTTKGDLFTFAAANARLGVGSDGQCLTAQSGQTTGLLWTSCTGGGTAFSAITSGTNTSAAMVAGSGSSLVPGGSGELVSNVGWLNPGGAGLYAPIPSVSVSLTGGSLSSGTILYLQITLSNSFGESLPSFELVQNLNGGAGCGSGTSCSATITAPTLLSGQTYTVYSSTIGTGAEKQQTASNNCVNITINCVIQVAGAGASPPVANTTIPVNPSPLGSSSSCAPWNTSGYVRDAAGNFQPAWAVDTTSSFLGFGKGNLTFCRPVLFNVTGVAPNFTPGGAAFTVFHIPSNTTSTVATQFQLNSLTTDNGTYAGQWLANYSETDIRGTETLGGGAIFGQVNAGAARFVMSVQPSGANSVGPTTGLSATNFREAGGTEGCGATDCYIGALSYAINLRNSASNGATYDAYLGESTQVGVNDSAGIGAVFHGKAPSNFGARFPVFNMILWCDDMGTSDGDWCIFAPSNSTATSNRNYFGGPVVLNGPILGSIAVTQLAAPTNGGVVATCVATCTATYAYKIVPVDASGGRGIASTALSTGAAAATVLNGSNFNTINIQAGGYTLGLTHYGTVGWDIYRTGSNGTPSTLGYIGTISCYTNGGGGCTFVDNGVAISIPTFADPVTPPTYNTTGAISGFTYRTNSKCSGVGTAASPSVVACGAAPAGAFSCATNASAATCTVNTTAVTANSIILVQESAAEGASLGVTCNTAPTVTPAILLATKTAGVGFTINMPTITVNPACFVYWVVD